MIQMDCTGSPCDSVNPYDTSAEIGIALVTAVFVLLNFWALHFMYQILRPPKKVIKTYRPWSPKQLLTKEQQSDLAQFENNFAFCILFSSGTIILLLSIFAWPLNESHNTCATKPAFLAFGLAMMFGALCGRVYKLWYQFVYLTRKKTTLTEVIRAKNSKVVKWDFYIVFGVIVFMETVLLAIFYSVSDFRPRCTCTEFVPEPNLDDPFRAYFATDGNKTFYSQCNAEANQAFGILLFLANVVPALLALILGFITIWEFKRRGTITRFPLEEFDDLEPILWTFIAILILFVGAIILDFTTRELNEDPTNRLLYYVFRSVLIILTCFIPITFLYKKRYDRYSKRKKAKLELDLEQKKESQTETQNKEKPAETSNVKKPKNSFLYAESAESADDAEGHVVTEMGGSDKAGINESKPADVKVSSSSHQELIHIDENKPIQEEVNKFLGYSKSGRHLAGT